MFAGIVEEAAVVVECRSNSAGALLRVKSRLDHQGTSVGDSICISGVCLTVIAIDYSPAASTLDFECSVETLRRTTLGDLSPGAAVNLERSLAVGSRLHGHWVSGHVDGCVTLVEKRQEGNAIVLKFKFPGEFRALIAPKGSIAVAGVSLTLGEVDDHVFSVYIIPHTAAVTTLGLLRPGMTANCELDMLARYVVSALAARSAVQQKPDTAMEQLLDAAGFTQSKRS